MFQQIVFVEKISTSATPFHVRKVVWLLYAITSSVTSLRSLLKEICHDVRTEPPLVEVNREVLNEQTVNTRLEARLDISALGFWTPD